MITILLRLALIFAFLPGRSLPLVSGSDLSGEVQTRRAAILERIGEGIALVESQTQSRGGSADNKFFYYLSGVRDRNALLVMAGGETPRTWLFNGAGKWTYGSLQGDVVCRPAAELLSTLRKVAFDASTLFISFSDLELVKNRLGGTFPLAVFSRLENLDPVLQDMRVLKSGLEVEFLQRAIDITADGLSELMRAVEPGMREFEMAAVLEYEFARRGSPGSTFLQAASGPNSTFVHFGAGNRALEKEDMIVVDVGAEWNGYTADITRSFPAGGRFTAAQRKIYSLVLSSQKAGIEKMRPGLTFGEAQQASEDVLMRGLAEMGLLTERESPWQKRLFIQHGFYHFIGLDIHDVWSRYARGVKDKVFSPGMIVTWEPGLYFPAGMLDEVPRRLKKMVEETEFRAFAEKIRPLYAEYADIGVRIEDDVLITEDGNRIVSARVPKEIGEIETLMKRPSPHNQFKKRDR